MISTLLFHCTSHSLLLFKVLHRAHMSKAKLAQIYPDLSPHCDKYGNPDTTLIHDLVLSQTQSILERFINPTPIFLTISLGLTHSGLFLVLQRRGSDPYRGLRAMLLPLLLSKHNGQSCSDGRVQHLHQTPNGSQTLCPFLNQRRFCILFGNL